MRIKKKYLQEKTDTSEKARKAIEDMVDTVEDELSVNEPEAKEFVKNYVIGSDVSESEDLNEVGPGKVHTKKFDRCVKDVKKNSPGVDNPYAVCQASLGAKAIKKSHQRKEDYNNESNFVMTKGELLESLNVKKNRKVIKTIKIKDIRIITESKTYIDPWDNREYSQEEVDEWIRKFKIGKRWLSAKDKRIYKDFFKRVGVDPKLLVKQSYWTTETKPKLEKILKKINAPKDFRKDVLFIFKRINTATNSLEGGMSYAQLYQKYDDYALMMAQKRVGHPNHYFGDDEELKKMWKDLNKEMGFVTDWEFGDMIA